MGKKRRWKRAKTTVLSQSIRDLTHSPEKSLNTAVVHTWHLLSFLQAPPLGGPPSLYTATWRATHRNSWRRHIQLMTNIPYRTLHKRCIGKKDPARLTPSLSGKMWFLPKPKKIYLPESGKEKSWHLKPIQKDKETPFLKSNKIKQSSASKHTNKHLRYNLNMEHTSFTCIEYLKQKRNLKNVNRKMEFKKPTKKTFKTLLCRTSELAN